MTIKKKLTIQITIKLKYNQLIVKKRIGIGGFYK